MEKKKRTWFQEHLVILLKPVFGIRNILCQFKHAQHKLNSVFLFLEKNKRNWFQEHLLILLKPVFGIRNILCLFKYAQHKLPYLGQKSWNHKKI